MYNGNEREDRKKGRPFWRAELGIIAVIITIILVICIVFKILSVFAVVFTCIPYIAFIIFFSKSGKLQKSVVMNGLNSELSEVGKRMVLKWTVFQSAIVILLSAAQFAISPEYIAVGSIGIIFCVCSIYLYNSAKYKLGKIRQTPFQMLLTHLNKDDDNFVKSKQTKQKKKTKQKKNKDDKEKALPEFILIECNNCGQRSRIPGNKGKLMVTCPKCGNTSEVEP